MYKSNRFNYQILIFSIISICCLIICCSVYIFNEKPKENDAFYYKLIADSVIKTKPSANTGGCYNEEVQESISTQSNSSEAFSTMTKSEILDCIESMKAQIRYIEEETTNSKSRAFGMDYFDFFMELNQQIIQAEEVLKSNNYLYPYTENDLNIMAYVIYREAGCYWLSDRHRDLVGCVFMNRKNQNGINQNLNNPSYADILNEDGQYPYKSKNVDPSVIHDYCYESAIRVLEHKVNCPENVVWQATFKQGSGVYDKFYDSVLGTTTYFCVR